MKVLLVSPYFPPQNAIASLRAHAFARHWASAGDDVTVLTTTKRPDQQGLDLPCDGFEVVEIPYRAPAFLEALRGRHKAAESNGGGGAGPLKRLMTHLRERRGVYASVRMPDLTDHWVAPAVAWCRGQAGWDVVLSSSGPYTAHLVALAVRRGGLAGRWAADYRDLWVGNDLRRGLFPFTLRERWLERRCLRRADLVVTVSEALARRLEARTPAPVEVVYNGFEPDELEQLPAQRIFPDDGRVRVVYTGSIYPAGQDIGLCLAALAGLRREHPDAAERLRLEVAGGAREVWLETARQHRVADLVTHHGALARPEARRMQRDADALLLIDFDAGIEGVLTGKAFEYVGVTAPIIAVGGPPGSPIARLMKATRRGVHLAGDRARITATLADVAAGRPILEGSADEASVNELTRSHQALRLRDRLLELTVGIREINAESRRGPQREEAETS
jgi:glycosyltransferase involved in cell wall biosynthesis